MKLNSPATAIIMNVIPRCFHVIRVTGKVHRVLLFAGRGHADVGGLVAKKLDRSNFIRAKAAILTVGGWALKIIGDYSPAGRRSAGCGVAGNIQAMLAGPKK